MAAFDAKQSASMTTAEKRLKKFVDKHDAAVAKANMASLKEDVTTTKAAAATATIQEGETPEDFTARQSTLQAAAVSAQKALDEELYQRQVAALTRKAEASRVDRNAEDALRRRHYETALTEIGIYLGKHGKKAADATNLVLKLMRSFHVDFKTVGDEAGAAFVRGLREALERAAGKAGGLRNTIESQAAALSVRGLASGGIVTRPTLAMIGERGPEAVVPLGRGSGGGGTVNITVNGWVGNDQDLARRLRDELVRGGRRNTSIFSAPGVNV